MVIGEIVIKMKKKNIRTRCSAIIIKGNNSILIDTSPDIRTQLLANKIKQISSVIFTHEHADQTNGLFELRPFFWKKREKINVYGKLSTIKHLFKSQNYLFKKTSFIIMFESELSIIYLIKLEISSGFKKVL